MSNSSASLNRSQNGQNRYSNHLNVSRREASSRELGVVNSPSLNNYLSQSYGGHTTQSSLGLSGLSSSFPSTTALGATAGGATSSQQVVYLTPNTQRTVDQLTEEEQVKLLKRMTLIQQLPTGSFDENKKHKEYFSRLFLGFCLFCNCFTCLKIEIKILNWVYICLYLSKYSLL